MGEWLGPLSLHGGSVFKGSYVALVTPFKNGRLDEAALARLIEFHLEGRTAGLVLCATTGESPTLTPGEWRSVIETAAGRAKGKLAIVAYTGSNDTAATVARTKEAHACGADAVLVVTPYYNKPPQEGLFRHFEVVAGESSLPIIIYNVPSRTGVNILPSTVVRLASLDRIAGIKEASGDLDQVSELSRLAGDRIAILSGDDSLTLPMLAVGAVGVISVVANIAPRDVAEMIDQHGRGEVARARQIHLALYPLVRALFVETNPIPVKRALSLIGLMGDEVRLPLVPLSKEGERTLRKALEEYGVLS
jgi:4-hydroxy-tetrahydrodipicolinate synthase